jgi:predicted metal-dependent phosphoesterase TrpH
MISSLLNVDLHSHSTISDGVLSPTEVAQRAKAQGVHVWALTDHDEVSGIAEARQAAHDLGLKFVTGVEISVTWANCTIHIVGLQIDETNPTLIAGLKKTRSGRDTRGRDMADGLAKVGIPNAFEGALKYVGNPDLISRSHFARYLIEIGVCPDVSSVFRNYLTEGKPGFVPHRWATLSDALAWIHAAGGVAVVAHPGRYNLSPLAMQEFLSEFKRLGGVGIEVVTGSHTPDQFDEYALVAERYGFMASRGSDFHEPGYALTELGQLPSLPKNLVPIWKNWDV